MKKRWVIITISVIAILMVIILTAPLFFPKFPDHSRSFQDIPEYLTSGSDLIIHNRDANRSYSIQISLDNGDWQNPRKDLLFLSAGSYNLSKILDSIDSGNYSMNLIVDSNITYEYPVTLPSELMFEILPDGTIERKDWVFIE
jgi:hypothetical protein